VRFQDKRYLIPSGKKGKVKMPDIYCRRCGKAALPADLFCMICGNPLRSTTATGEQATRNNPSALNCPDCGGAISDEDIFCSQCGVNLDEPIVQELANLTPFETTNRKQVFSLDPGGEQRLIIAWKGIWTNASIYLDKKPIGLIPDKKLLIAGQDLLLPDGSTIKVQLDPKKGINVFRNGQLLPGSASDPKVQHKGAYELAYGIVYFVGGINILLGLATSLFKLELFGQASDGLYQLLFGLIFLALGFFVQRKSNVALILAIVIFGLDGLVGVISTMGSYLTISIILSRMLFITPMIQGVSAIDALNHEK
jgi:ribosomal protein L37E